MSLKTSTCILFKPNKQFDSFGYDAEDAYGELSAEETGEHKKWYYFRRFKMELFNNVVCYSLKCVFIYAYCSVKGFGESDSLEVEFPTHFP